jgi:hypothetical protein
VLGNYYYRVLLIKVTVRNYFRRASVRVSGFAMSQYFTELNRHKAASSCEDIRGHASLGD